MQFGVGRNPLYRAHQALGSGRLADSSIITADQNVPTGLAIPLPVISKAEP